MPDQLESLRRSFDNVDHAIAGWMRRNGSLLLRISLGVIFVWFGALKFFDGLSPAESLVRSTVYWVDPDIFLPILGAWEVLIGLGLLYRPAIRVAIFLLFAQMPGTMLPLILLPEVCFTIFPFGLTLEGQYIIKNLVLISAALVVGGTVRSDIRSESYRK
ncbi:DoxX family membrane protein [Longibacter salinarum]|nr:DoxX family membrane protein [Longibacter salinarum]